MAGIIKARGEREIEAFFTRNTTHTDTMKPMTLFAFLTCAVASSLALPYPYPMAYPFPQEPGYGAPSPSYEPKGYEPKGYEPKGYEEPLGRVKIQVYRGPNQNKCKYDDPYCNEFAPWGYYNTQPADLKKTYGYH